MELIQKQIARLNLMKNSVLGIAINELKKEADLFTKLNVDQLKKGTDAFGRPTPEYASSNKKTGNITFIDKGGFTNGIKPVFGSNRMAMTSTDDKNPFLNPWKGKTETLGINPNNRALIVMEIIPNVLLKLNRL